MVEPSSLAPGRRVAFGDCHIVSRLTGPTLEPFAGRVDHLATCRRLRFESFAAFQAAMIRLLTDTKQTRDEGDPAR